MSHVCLSSPECERRRLAAQCTSADRRHVGQQEGRVRTGGTAKLNNRVLRPKGICFEVMTLTWSLPSLKSGHFLTPSPRLSHAPRRKAPDHWRRGIRGDGPLDVVAGVATPSQRFATATNERTAGRAARRADPHWPGRSEQPGPALPWVFLLLLKVI